MHGVRIRGPLVGVTALPSLKVILELMSAAPSPDFLSMAPLSA
jgi:hypothetical protein